MFCKTQQRGSKHLILSHWSINSIEFSLFWSIILFLALNNLCCGVARNVFVRATRTALHLCLYSLMLKLVIRM